MLNILLHQILHRLRNGRVNFGIAVLDKWIYMFGGEESHTSQKLNVVSGTWKDIAEVDVDYQTLACEIVL